MGAILQRSALAADTTVLHTSSRRKKDDREEASQHFARHTGVVLCCSDIAARGCANVLVCLWLGVGMCGWVWVGGCSCVCVLFSMHMCMRWTVVSVYGSPCPQLCS